MNGRVLSKGLYRFDDFQIEDRIETNKKEISLELIDRFADLTGDNFAIHISDDAARAVGFERRVAHGLLILSLTDGLKNQTDIKINAVASLGWDCNFKRVVLVGDVIRAVFTVQSKRLTRDSTRGIIAFAVDVLNQRDEIVQQGTNNLLVLV